VATAGFTQAQLLGLLDMQRDGGWRDERAAVPRTIVEVHSEAAAEKAAAEEATRAALRNDGRGQRHGGDYGRGGPWTAGEVARAEASGNGRHGRLSGRTAASSARHQGSPTAVTSCMRVKAAFVIFLGHAWPNVRRVFEAHMWPAP
jgi:hypothetical protein